MQMKAYFLGLLVLAIIMVSSILIVVQVLVKLDPCSEYGVKTYNGVGAFGGNYVGSHEVCIKYK